MKTEPWLAANGAARAVALEVLRHGPLSRSEIARRLDLSAGSLTRLSSPLIEQGLLVETGSRLEGRSGRPSRPLDVEARSRHFVGLKLTGDAVHGVVTDFRTAVVGRAERQLTSQDPETVVAALAAVSEELGATVPHVSAVGVGVGGQVEGHAHVRSAPFLDWEDVPLRDMLELATGLDVVVENDLTALTIAEHWFGGGRGLDRFAVVTVGAGVGYGLVANGEVVVNEDSGLGLVGHWPVEPFGPVCPAGHRGCARAVLTTAAVEQAVAAALGRPVRYDEAIALAEDADPAACRVVGDAARGLGRLLGAVANLTVPQRILLGGEGVRLAEVATDSLREGIAEARDPRASRLDITVIGADNADWCRGAAAVAVQHYVSSTT